MPMLLQSIKVVNLMVLMLFLGCAFYSLCVHSETPPGREGALTVVETDEDDNDGIISIEENGEDEGNKKVEEYDVFYPTREWQTVKKGQAIPKGLHVRMNLEKGVTEAKLNEDEGGNKFWQAGSHQGMVNTDKKSFSRDELKKALKDFKSHTDTSGQDPKSAAEVKKKFRSYNDLKKDFEEMNIAMKTDGEIISDLLERFKKVGSDTDAKLNVLTELEYHLHKIDNAQLFSSMGGMSLLVASLNDTSPKIQEEAALVLGSALQSNPKVQISAIEHGAMHQLIKMLSTTSSTTLQKKTLFALSSLARHFPYAQKKFLELGGLAALKRLFDDSSMDAQKLQIKALTFLSDLLVEKGIEFNLKSSMRESGWCELVPQLLTAPDHDAREKVLNAMTTLVSECRPTFTSAVTSLESLKSEYEALALDEKEEGDDYFTGLAQLVTTMLSTVQRRDEL
ncbi:LOW QUALITY PROTEIN: nucleotide exchange factor SIL1-like [Haliotis rubra]|uniref:LOW QUALITY PROTEIN: nucleotide exchange factor SIL1-like n=1 Tax=Haliotis rubra TaxID=36100 RepID=UPI001EE5A6AB|nr:LOW QUALITY PROTEIN: nucleotide exchange factor SIL1-like [Haliotis rubra]